DARRAHARSELRRHSPWAIGRPRPMGRLAGKLVEGDLDRAIELWVGAARVVLWRIVDFDVRIGAVVFDSPADIVEEEREFRLGGRGAIHQPVTRPDADDTAPGSLAHQRPEPHQLEGVGEDVAVRAGELVR